MSRIQPLRGKLYAVKGRPISLPNGQSILTANSIFIDDTKKAIIDPSSDPLILREIAKENIVDSCFFSHSHLDHIYSYGLFPNSEYFIHEDDPAVSGFFRRARHFPTEKVWRALGLQWFRPHGRFKDGAIFKIGKTTMCVIHTPGHARGHSCFYFPNEGILYSADFDLSIVGPWYGQADSSIDDFLNSAERLRAVEADVWVTGHVKWIVHDNVFGELDKFMRKIEERESRLVDCLDKSRSVEDMSKIGLITPLSMLSKNPSLRKSEKTMLIKNLERLRACNRVRRVRGGQWVRVEARGEECRRGREKGDPTEKDSE